VITSYLGMHLEFAHLPSVCVA